jgi:hypothetical protein
MAGMTIEKAAESGKESRKPLSLVDHEPGMLLQHEGDVGGEPGKIPGILEIQIRKIG